MNRHRHDKIKRTQREMERMPSGRPSSLSRPLTKAKSKSEPPVVPVSMRATCETSRSCCHCRTYPEKEVFPAASAPAPASEPVAQLETPATSTPAAADEKGTTPTTTTTLTVEETSGPTAPPMVIIVYGFPGRGKSTFASYLTKALPNVKLISGDGFYVAETLCNKHHIGSHIDNQLRLGNTALFDGMIRKLIEIVQNHLQRRYIVMEGYLFSKIWMQLKKELNGVAVVVPIEKVSLDTIRYKNTVYQFERSNNPNRLYSRTKIREVVADLERGEPRFSPDSLLSKKTGNLGSL